MTNISNKCFLRGAINGAGLADSPGIGLATWRPTVALTWESLWAIAGRSFRRMN